MQINLPDAAAGLIREKAAAAGFADQIDAYVAHLIASDEVQDSGAPIGLSLAGKDREEIGSMLSAGFASGSAAPMTEDDWRRLHDRVNERSH